MAACGETESGATGASSRVGRASVSFCADHVLRDGYRIANGAVLSCGESRPNTGGFNRRIGDEGVPLGGNRGLRNDDGIAGGAMLTASQSRIAASRVIALVRDEAGGRVVGGVFRNRDAARNIFVAVLAICARGQTFCITVGGKL